jgi:O-acetyl-ADP-ribose deacetylase (regulator of RNase III)
VTEIQSIEGNILDSKADVIGQQCNCVTMGNGKGLAAQIFSRFPYADVYSKRTEHNKSVPGTWTIHGNGQDERYILNLYTQYYPGGAKYNSDSEDLRLRWFQTALTGFFKTHPGKSLALPHGIGCGLAGGNWSLYERAIKEAAATSGAQIILYKFVEGAALRSDGIALKMEHDRNSQAPIPGIPRQGPRSPGDPTVGTDIHR